MGMADNNNLPEIRNYMEDCVRSELVHVLSDLGVCTCTRCCYDVLALVLNELPPKYVVTRKGQMYAKLSMLQQQFTVDIITEVTKAARIVSQDPRHEPGSETGGKFPEGMDWKHPGR